VFSFGVEVLIERGWALASAGSLTSSFMFVASIALPLGGILADRTGRRDTVIAVSLLGYACLMPLLLYAPAGAVPVVLAVAGALFALGGGPIMTLPAMVLSPKSRAFGMGVFFTIYYVLMMLAPGLAGALAEWTGSVGSAIWLGVGMVLICLLALVLFRQSVARRAVVAA
jgi:MFS family permease